MSRKWKARIRFPTCDATVFVYADTQYAARELIKVQYAGAVLIGGYVGLA